MLRRLYVNNFRCLEKFELQLDESPTWLLVGRNGTGKSTVGAVLEVLQRLAAGTSRVGELIRLSDVTEGQAEIPVRLEVRVAIDGRSYDFHLALELPPRFRELRVAEESLAVDGQTLYSRKLSEVRLFKAESREAQFPVDWHLVALPIIQESAPTDPLSVFRRWLARMLVLAPLPGLMTGESEGETLRPTRTVNNFGEWFTGVMVQWPAAYGHVERYARDVMPDFLELQNPEVGEETRSLIVTFRKNGRSTRLPFKQLSDGEKCFFVCALVLAANHFVGPLLCFWDEPDSHLSISEVGHFVMELRRAFRSGGGQLLVVSHNPEAIRQFSDVNTQLLSRHSHLEPTITRRISDLELQGELVSALIRDDLVP